MVDSFCMAKMKVYSLLITSSVIILAGFSFAVLGLQYEVKSGDVLSVIAHKNFEGEVYGRRGSLMRLLELNPGLRDNPDLIFPGQKLILQASNKEIASPKTKINQRATNSGVETSATKEANKKKLSNKPSGRKFAIQRVPTSTDMNEAGETESVKVKNRYSTVSLIPNLSYFRFSGIDTSNNAKARLYSSESFGVDLSWKQHWSSAFATSIELQYQGYELQETSSRSLSEASVTTGRIGLGVESRFSEAWIIQSSFYYGSHAYLYAPSSSALRIDKGNAFSIKAGLSYRLVDLSPFVLDLLGGGHMTTPADVDNYRSEFGYAGHLGLDFSHTLKGGTQIKGIFKIALGKHDTKPVEQTHDHLSLGVGIVWRLE